MKILIDILHPAHVHFFRNAIGELKKRGHNVLVTARDKDLTCRLLDLYEIPYRTISREAAGKGRLAVELASRNLKMAGIVLREKPEVLASIGGISTAQTGFFLGRRNLIFYDTENAALSNRLSYPFATRVLTPDCYRGPVPKKKHIPYAGYHELAYLHPERFAPDPELLVKAGIDVHAPYSVVRFVSWKAMHDIKAKGYSIADKRTLARTLEQYGKVYVTSETPLPGEFEKYRVPIAPHHIHHVLAFAKLFIGESATMASESAVLGTPFVYLDVVGRGYTDEQEEKYGLGFNFRPVQVTESVCRAEEILKDNVKESDAFRERHTRMLADKIDVTAFIVDKLLKT